MSILDRINNVPIGTRLFAGFIIVTLLMGSIGVIGFIGMNSIGSGLDKVYAEGTVPLLEVSGIETSLNSIRALVFRTVAIPGERAQDKKRITDEIATVDTLIARLKTESLKSEEAANLTLFEKQWNDYKVAATGVVSLLDAGNEKEASVSLANGGAHANARRATADTFNNLKRGILANAESIAASGKEEKNRTVPVMLVLGIGAVIIALAFAVILTRSIVRPLKQVMSSFERMSRGEISGRLNLSRRDELGDMADMFDRFCNYLEHDVVGTMHRIAAGDLSASIGSRGAGDQITPSLTATLSALNEVISELSRLSEQATAGDLSVRGDPGNLSGSYQEIVLGFNGTLEALIRPLEGAIELAKEYADCNFTARFPGTIRTEGDFRVFRDALDAIGSEVSSALIVVERQMTELSDHSQKAILGIDDVKKGAGIIADNATQTQQNAERSEEGISQVLRAMEDLTSTVASVSSNVETVAQAGVQADHLAKRGILSAATAEEGMTSIRSSSTEVDQIITEIQSRMHDITKIIGIITDISEQTNLLALNAAIEAARAGDAGLGFAVVAGEVKALANQTGESAQKIAVMIDGLSKQTNQAVTAMDRAGESVDQGSVALQETIQAFNELTDAVGAISTNMASVAGASEEQAASFEEITASVNEMSGLVKETAKDAITSSSTAEEALAVVGQITSIIDEINVVVATTRDEMKRFKVS
jgi:methyl-accepting chemotaxis protein